MAAHQPSGNAADVVIVGGGVAALEALMALRDLAGEHLGITVVAPDADFVYRPMAVVEPFGAGPPRRYPLREIAADFGARLVRAMVTSVDADGGRVVLRSGATLAYETLVLAPGARTLPAFDDAITFGHPGSADAMRALVAEVEQGTARRVAFVMPSAVGWNLPLYELALMLGRQARRQSSEGTAFSLITPENRPLALFGDRPSAAVARLLEAAGVEFIGSMYADVHPGTVALHGPAARCRSIAWSRYH